MSRSTDRPTWRDVNAESELFDFHRGMLVDSARMQAYRDAITAAVRPGNVVLDIGSGTGVLAFLACSAGASRVHAVEQGPVIELARDLSERNGFADRIVFSNDWSTSVQLPALVDVVVTETIGNAAVDEGILGWVIDARTRLLRPGGLVVPRRLQLWTAAVESWDDHALVADWSAPDLPADYRAARERAEQTLWWVDLDGKHVISDPVLVADIDLERVAEPGVAGHGELRCLRDGTLHGLACWFDAELSAGIHVTNAPPTQVPSWSQGFLPTPTPLGVSAGQPLAWEISASANGEEWRWSVEPM